MYREESKYVGIWFMEGWLLEHALEEKELTRSFWKILGIDKYLHRIKVYMEAQ